MARLTTSGFEFQVIDTAAAGRAEEIGYRNVGAPTIDTTVKRSGAASLKTSNPAAPAYARFIGSGASANMVVDRDYYARAYLRLSDTTPAVNLGIMRFENGAGGRVLEVRITTAGAVRLIDSANAQIGSDGAALTADTWYMVELRSRVNGTTGTAGNAELRITEDIPGAPTVTVASSIGAANLGTTAAIRFHVGNVVGNSSGIDLWADDVAINDDQGSDENSWCGPGKVVLLKPTADTVFLGDWKNGAGGTTNLWDALENTPPTGVALGSAGATTQIRNALSSDTDFYAASGQSYAAAGIVSTDRVKLVQTVAAVANSTTSARTLALRHSLNPVGTSTAASTGTTAAGTYPTGWQAVRSQISYAPTVILGDSIVLQLIKAEATTEELQACLLGAYVEYVPAVNVDVDAANIAVAGQAPTVAVSSAASTGTIPVTGQAPASAVSQAAAIGAVTVAGLAADLAVSIAVPVANVAVEGLVPSSSISDQEDVGVADVAVTGLAPSTGVSQEASTGAVTASGLAPGVSVGIDVSTAQIAVEGQAPTLGGDVAISVDTATIAVEGMAPTVSATSPQVQPDFGGVVIPRRRLAAVHAVVVAGIGRIHVQGWAPTIGVVIPSDSGQPPEPDTELEDLELLLLS